MSFCVNINSNEFKTLLKDTGLDSFSLELKVKSWQISNGIDAFPTAKEVLSNSSQSGIGYNLKATSLIMNNLDKVNNWFKQMKNTDAERAKKYKEFGIKKSDGTKITEQDIEQNPTFYQNNTNQTTEEFVASEKTIRDLAARMSDRIGIPVRFESDRTKKYKGKLENGTAVVNLAYATLDTPIHEILGHPIIRAIKYSKNIGGTITLKGLDTSTKKQELSQLYQNLLKELEYGRGKEVLDRIKRDYNKKFERGKSFTFEGKNYIADTASKTGYRDKYGDDVDSNELETALFAYELKHKDEIYYTLEEQQEEAIVELLGLMTADRLDKVKDGKLISLLKRLLKEMKAFVRSLLNQKEVEIDKLPDNMTLGDIADLLAYSNSKLILPGNEVVYTTPDNQQFKTYAEASKHISDLAKSVEDVDLSDKILVLNTSNSFTIFDKYGSAVVTRNSFEEAEKYAKETNLPHGYRIQNNNKNLLNRFIEKNKEYEQSKEIIEEWKKVNNIQYNPEEVLQ